MSEVGKWGFPVPKQSHFREEGGSGLAAAVAALNSQTKQAMYAAASKRNIKRGTWNGCAFNAAGSEVSSSNVSSTEAAAETFGLTAYAVSRFISAWDATVNSMSETEATEYLKTLLTGDLYTDGSGSLVKHTEPADYVVYKSMEQRIAEFEEQFENDTVPLTDEAVELLLCGA